MDVLDLDAFSSCAVSILDDISLSGVLPLDTAVFGEGPNWTTNQTDNQNQCWPRQIGLSNPYSQVLSPLEGLFPCTNQTWIGSPAGTSTSQEVRSPNYKAYVLLYSKYMLTASQGRGAVCQ
jgi:hypothetical protein